MRCLLSFSIHVAANGCECCVCFDTICCKRSPGTSCCDESYHCIWTVSCIYNIYKHDLSNRCSCDKRILPARLLVFSWKLLLRRPKTVYFDVLHFVLLFFVLSAPNIWLTEQPLLKVCQILGPRLKLIDSVRHLIDPSHKFCGNVLMRISTPMALVLQSFEMCPFV